MEDPLRQSGVNHSVGVVLQVEVTTNYLADTPQIPCIMTTEMKETSHGDVQAPAHDLAAEQQHGADTIAPANSSKLIRVYAHPWTQILLISFICFCLPGVSVVALEAAMRPSSRVSD
jgi:hypothetical protein